MMFVASVGVAFRLAVTCRPVHLAAAETPRSSNAIHVTKKRATSRVRFWLWPFHGLPFSLSQSVPREHR